MIKKVEAWCLQHGLLKRKQKILIACSGGPDSLALADILLRLSGKYRLELAAAHFNHMFRGAEADADEAFVAEFCEQRGLKYYQGKADVPKFIFTNHLSPEEGARILRYRFLRQTAEQLGGAKIAVAHHRDDQAETVLLHLLRGAGSGGLGGMKAVNNDIIRPFLGISRREIEEYCEYHDLQPRLDKTNLETEYLRNRIRLNLLPELAREYNPAVKAALCRSAELIGDEHEFIKIMAKSSLDSLLIWQNNDIILPRAELSKLHIALLREIFRLAIEKKCGHIRGIGFLHVEKMIELTKYGTVGSRIELPGGLYFYCDYANMCLADSIRPAIKASELCQTIAVNAATECPELGYSITTSVCDRQTENKLPGLSMWFDYDKVKLPLTARFRQNGDIFQPLGMRGHKKLKDFFIDAKLPREQRDKILLVSDAEEILWLAGIRQSEKAKISKRTRRFLQINIMAKDD